MKINRRVHNYPLLVFFLIGLTLVGCSERSAKNKQIIVKNTLEIDRSLETVAVNIASLNLDSTLVNSGILGVVESETGKELTSQTVDTNGDGTMDQILFQPEIKALSENRFRIVRTDKKEKQVGDPICYSRFVPERTDDYTWENNRVAFRTYGPTGQKEALEGVPGSTLSSGIDAWLKRVEYPIINKWYKKTVSGKGSYHEDTGEGLDNFHVGDSRGIGGTAVKVDTTYYVSKNYDTWKTITTGPIRTSFIITYASWDAAGLKISESKHISLDYGSNLSRIEVAVKGTDRMSAGLTLHENAGVTTEKPNEGWLSYWEPHGDSELGSGIVAPKEEIKDIEKYVSSQKDLSNLYMRLKVNDGKIVYYAGFGWKKSGQFQSRSAWNQYLSLFALKINNPMEVLIE
ncbi:DUF4861 domain-containing protein [Flavobacteriaceae bacterium F89]|uniref:DUF4861 domain-containing protein n=1 Tax=Cerina litoralis TaxID=2874477 RepID=A0AAE3ETQ8_9FLAO|nr:DUF4861 family protein [Cerina litoralis]MCG2460248.1 DUF4861 domain-containing protein [Cerina litoralis]